LDFIKKEKKIVLLTKLLHSPEEFWSCQMNTPFALNGFKHDGAGVRSYGGGKRGEVVEWAMAKPGKQGVESFLHLALCGSGNPSESSAMEGLVKSDDLMTRLA
tara:strand:+ start:566 stop:874 length:309 start_codon:yes stop_codon:yes gene_type:complete